jgi:hypothetical protein
LKHRQFLKVPFYRHYSPLYMSLYHSAIRPNIKDTIPDILKVNIFVIDLIFQKFDKVRTTLKS